MYDVGSERASARRSTLADPLDRRIDHLARQRRRYRPVWFSPAHQATFCMFGLPGDAVNAPMSRFKPCASSSPGGAPGPAGFGG